MTAYAARYPWVTECMCVTPSECMYVVVHAIRYHAHFSQCTFVFDGTYHTHTVVGYGRNRAFSNPTRHRHTRLCRGKQNQGMWRTILWQHAHINADTLQVNAPLAAPSHTLSLSKHSHNWYTTSPRQSEGSWCRPRQWPAACLTVWSEGGMGACIVGVSQTASCLCNLYSLTACLYKPPFLQVSPQHARFWNQPAHQLASRIYTSKLPAGVAVLYGARHVVGGVVSPAASGCCCQALQ